MGTTKGAAVQVREEAEAYFRHGGHRAEHVALALYQRHLSLPWREIVQIVVAARKAVGGAQCK